MFYSLPHKYPLKQNRLLVVVRIQVDKHWLLVFGKFETQGSNFRHETRSCEATAVPYYFREVKFCPFYRGIIVSVSSVGSCVDTISIINPCGKQILVCPTLEIQPVLTAIWSGLLSSLSLILVPSTSIILY